MPPTRTGVDRAESRTSSPFSPSLHPNDNFENEDNLDGNSESRWKRLYLQEQKKRLNEENTKKKRNE